MFGPNNLLHYIGQTHREVVLNKRKKERRKKGKGKGRLWGFPPPPGLKLNRRFFLEKGRKGFAEFVIRKKKKGTRPPDQATETRKKRGKAVTHRLHYQSPGTEVRILSVEGTDHVRWTYEGKEVACSRGREKREERGENVKDHTT